MLTTAPPKIYVTDELFWDLCQVNPDLRLERTAAGELIVNPPTGSETSNYNLGVAARVWIWNEQTQLGKAFDSSGGFKLPNGAIRSPDAAWVRLDRWESLSQEQRQKFAPLAPDFALELMSPSDRLVDAQEKMQEYMDNGVRLGWLINPSEATVEIYRPGQPVQVLSIPARLKGEDVLPGFELVVE
ncbi:MAG: Uma2 family endonuclease [Microcoleaceae cyanobacterium]